MSDDFAIQQQRPSATPYVLGGGLLGAAGGAGLGLKGPKWATEPAKYSSYEDLLKEADDKFTSSMKDVETDIKTEAENARKAYKEAGANWDKELAAYKEANKAGEAPQLAADSAEMKALAEKEQALNAKRAELEKAKSEEIRKANTGELTPQQKKSIEQMNKSIEGIESKKNAYISAREKAINEVNTKIAEPRVSYTYTEFGKTITAEGNAFEQLMQQKKSFDATITNIESHLKDKKFKKGSEVTFIDPKTKKIVTRVPENTQEVKAAKEYFKKQHEAGLKRMFPSLDAGLRQQVSEEAMNVIANNQTINESVATKADFLSKKAARYNTALKDIPTEADVLTDFATKAKGNAAQENLLQRLTTMESGITSLKAQISATTDAKELKKLNKELELRLKNAQSLKDSIRSSYYSIIDAPLTTLKGDLETQKLYQKIQRANELVAKENGMVPSRRRIGRFFGIMNPTKLNSAEAAELKKLQTELAEVETNLGTKEFEALTARAAKAKNVEANIANLESQITPLQESITKRNEAQRTVKQINKEIETWAGKGATINSAGEIIKADGTKFIPDASTNLASRVSVPLNDPRIEKFDRQIAGIKGNIPQAGGTLTEEQIAAKAKAAITDDMVKAEKEAVTAAQKAVDEARAKLPKNPEKTAEQLTKEFIEKNGERDKAIKEAAGKYKDKLTKLFEGKTNNTKLAGLMIGGAVALAGLGYLVAPKSNNA